MNPYADGKELFIGVANRKRKPDNLYRDGSYWHGGKDESQLSGFEPLRYTTWLETAHYPECTGYNLTIPAGATINVIIE